MDNRQFIEKNNFIRIIDWFKSETWQIGMNYISTTAPSIFYYWCTKERELLNSIVSPIIEGLRKDIK